MEYQDSNVETARLREENWILKQRMLELEPEAGYVSSISEQSFAAEIHGCIVARDRLLTRAKAGLQQLGRELEQTQTQLSQAKQEMQRLEGEVQRQQTQMSAVQVERDELARKLYESTKQNDQLSVDLAQHKFMLKDLGARLNPGRAQEMETTGSAEVVFKQHVAAIDLSWQEKMQQMKQQYNEQLDALMREKQGDARQSHDAISQAEAKARQLQAQVAEQKCIAVSAQEQLKQARIQADQYQDQLVKLHETLESNRVLQLKNREFETVIAQAQDRIQNQQQMLLEAKTEAQAAKQELQKQKEKLANTQAALREAGEELDAVQRRLRQEKLDGETKAEQLAREKNASAKFEEEAKTAKQEVQKLMVQLEALKQAATDDAQARQAIETAYQELQQNHNELVEQCDIHQKTSLTSRDEALSAMKKLQEVNGNYQSMQIKFSALQAEHAALQSRFDVYQQHAQKTMDETGQTAVEAASLRQERLSLISKVEALSGQLAQREQELADAKAGRETATRELKEAQDSLVQFKAQHQTLAQENQTLQTLKTLNSRSIQDAQTASAELRKDLANVRREAEQMRRGIQDIQEALIDVGGASMIADISRDEGSDMAAVMQLILRQIQDAFKKLKAKELTDVDTKRSMAQLQQDLAKQQTRTKELEDTIAGYEKRIQEAETNFAKKEEECAQALQQRQQLRDQKTQILAKNNKLEEQVRSLLQEKKTNGEKLVAEIQAIQGRNRAHVQDCITRCQTKNELAFTNAELLKLLEMFEQ